MVQFAYQASQASITQQQQFIMPTPSAQYAYMTSDGQIIAAPTPAAATGGIVPQVGMSYGIVGNTLVQMPQTQYIAVDSNTGVVLGHQGGVQYAVTAGGDEGRYMTVGGTTGYITVGGGGQVLAAPEGGSQMAVVQDANGQQRIVALPAPTQATIVEEIKKPSPEEAVVITMEEPSGSSLNANPVGVKAPVVVKEEKREEELFSESPETDIRVENGVEHQTEAGQAVRSEELAAASDDKLSTAAEVSKE